MRVTACSGILLCNGNLHIPRVVFELLFPGAVTGRELDTSLVLLETLRGLGLYSVIAFVRVELVAGLGQFPIHGDMGDQRVVAGAVDIELGAA